MRAHIIALSLWLAACAHTPSTRPDPALADGPAIPGLAVLPAPGPDIEGSAGSLAAAEVVFTALEARQPAAVLKSLEALVRANGPAGACLLEAAWTAECLAGIHPGAWLEVRLEGTRLEGTRLQLTLHDGSGAPRRLPDLEAGLPVETLGPALLEMLALSRAPAPRDPAEIPPSQQGICLEPDAFTPFGHGLRALLTARSGGKEEGQGARALELLTLAHATSPTLLVAARLADARREAGALATALEALPAELPSRCGLAPALAARARIRFALEDPVEAVADLARSARLRPYSDEALSAWAEGLLELEHPADAVLVWRRAVALAPGRLDYRRRLADALVLDGQRKEARAALSEALVNLRRPVDRAWIELDLGHLAEQDEDWDRVVVHDARGLKLLEAEEAPELRAALLNSQGVAFAALEELEKAELALEEAVVLRRQGIETGAAGDRLEGRHRLANSLYNLGTVKAREGKWRQATSALLEAASLYEGAERGATWLDLARLLQQGGMSGTALEVLEQARQTVTLEPASQAEWWFLYGLSLAGGGRTDAALEALTTAAGQFGVLGLRYEEMLAWFNRGVVAAHEGRKGEAGDAWRRARGLAEVRGDQEALEQIDARLSALEAPEQGTDGR